MFRQILLAYDGSEHADRAAEYTKELAKEFGGEVTIVYAFHSIPRSWGVPLVENAMQQETTQAREMIDRALKHFEGSGVHVDTDIVEGPAAEAILRVAEAHDVRLIVIGSRGLGQATGFFLGSVSDRVMHRAQCPVLVVK